jgi:hypothetical protein
MTPKVNAEELVDKFKYNTRAWNETNGWEDCFYNAKECALIAVNEILKVAFYADDKIYNHYLEVKQEIEKL